MKLPKEKIIIKNLGEAINLTTLSKSNIEMIRRWRNHPSIRKWMYQKHLISRKEHIRFVKQLTNDKKNYMWLVRRTSLKGTENIGIISINKLDLANKHAYLGIYANPQTKIPGSGHILMHFLKTIAFKYLKLHTLKLEVIRTNERAISFYHKHGFIKEGKLKDYVRIAKDKYEDVIIMGIIRK